MILRTQHLWDGSPAAESEVATVKLALHADHLQVSVSAPFHDDPRPDGPTGPRWRLWEHEVVELFLAFVPADAPPVYTEIELGPHGHHLVLQLVGVRNPIARELPLAYVATRDGSQWHGEATVPLSLLPPGTPPSWRVNVAAIHGPPSARRYLTAARLQAAEPDFHRPAEFLPFRGD